MNEVKSIIKSMKVLPNIMKEEMMDPNLISEVKPCDKSDEFYFWKSTEVSPQKEVYVYDVVTNSDFLIGASLSNCKINILDPEKLLSTNSWRAHDKQITALKFCPTDQHNLISSSVDGNISLWDIRKANNSPCLSFKAEADKLKPITCFDIDYTGNYLCAGTELIYQDSFILFWDFRKAELLGAYWDSHFDDITQVKFHPAHRNLILSGSFDGLINLFDITKTNEDDALITTLNAESSIYKLSWISGCDKKLVCLTYDHCLQIWNVKKTSPSFSIAKEEYVHSNIKAPINYLVDVVRSDSSRIQFMSGIYDGPICIWDIQGRKCSLVSTLMSHHNSVIRTCHWNEQNKIIVIGGEDGHLYFWKSKEERVNPPSIESQEIDTLDTGEEKTDEQNKEETVHSETKRKTVSSIKASGRVERFKPYEIG